MWKNNKKDVPADLDSVTRRLSWESLTAGGGELKGGCLLEHLAVYFNLT